MAMNFLGKVERCRAGHRLHFEVRPPPRRCAARASRSRWATSRRSAGGRLLLVIAAVTLTILGLDTGRASGWASIRASGCCRAAPRRSAARRRRWRLSAALPTHPQEGTATLFTVVGVSTLSTVGMLLYPPIARLLGFDDMHAGIFIGASMHDVAQVVGAGYARFRPRRATRRHRQAGARRDAAAGDPGRWAVHALGRARAGKRAPAAAALVRRRFRHPGGAQQPAAHAATGA